ncbi:MAG TPA: AMP-binding protein, partial [Candidatus Dormibacteraeota bacterium]
MQPVVIGDVIWEPSDEVIARSRLKRFMDQHGIETFRELLKRADDDIEWFWDAAIKDIDIAFYRHYDKVVDLSDGKPWARWWIGARMNIVQSCLDRHRDSEFHDKLAVIWEGEPGEVRKLTYGELDEEVCRLAGALRKLGVRTGDRVGIFMPMCPEVAISVLATTKIGAVIIPIFSGYGAEAIATRLQDAEAKVLICADGFYRRGQVVPMKETADRALVSCPTVTKVIVHRRVVREIPWTHGRDQVWEVLLEDEPRHAPTHELDPEDPLMIIYTSGTTGKPKGTVHVHGGFPVKTAQDMAHGFDIGADDTVFWYTDIGWMMGPWLILGSLALGATMVLYEGTPDHPAPDRLWRMVADHKVTVLGVSPTLVRGLMTHGDELPARHDLSSLRILGGTEISGGILCGNVITHLRPCSFAGPLPG